MKEKTILFQYNIDSYGNPTSTKIKEVAQVSPLKYTIQLEQIPDEQYGVTLLNEDNTSMFQVFNYDDVEKTENSYYVNYTNGLIYFNSNQGAEKKIINYYGTGIELISCKRVFDGHYDANGNWIVEILQDIIDAGREAIEAMKTIGDVMIILQMLSDKIAEGELKLQELQNAIDEANDLAKITENERIIINESDWVYNSTTKLYEYTITHTMNSTNLIINCYNKDTNEFVSCAGKIIDASSVLMQIEEKVNLKVILNARYFKVSDFDYITEDLADKLQVVIDEASDLIEATGNDEVIISASNWISDGNGGYYAIVNHNCNSESIHVTFKKTATKENVILGYTIIDDSSFKVYSTDNVSTSCVISAMYYRATKNIGDDIAQEVVQARDGERALRDRLDKIELTAENGLSGVRDLQRDNYDIKQRVRALEVSGENPYVIDLRQETDYDPNNADVCLNRVLANVPENCTVILNDDEIIINSQVKITLGKGSKVFINACVKTTGYGFEIIGNHFNNNVYIKSIVGASKNSYDGITLRNMYNGYISIDEISGFSRGINLQPTKNDGIQYCKIEWLSISNCSSCIVLDASLGNGGSCWVNENTFTGGRLSGDTGVYSIPINSPAEYNNNKFYNVGFEGITNRCVLLNMSKSFSFDNPRIIEGFPSGLWIEELDGCSRNTYSIPYGVPVGKYKLGYSSNIKAPILDSTWANPVSYHVQNTWDNSIDEYVDIYEKIPNCTYIREADFYNAGGTVTINSNSTTINITLASTDRIIRIPDYLSYNGNTFLLSFIHSGAGQNGRLRVDHVDKSGTHTGKQFYGEGTYQLINHGGTWLCNKIDNGLVVNS